MSFVHVGHYTDHQHKTGSSVFLFETPARAVYLLCGAAPATRDVHTLEPASIVDGIHGLVLTGGSAFGLDAVAGAMTFLREKNRGFMTPSGVVPIVPAAAMYDLTVSTARPTADNVYQACQAAVPDQSISGRIGAGTGASVGKMIPHAKAMSSGLGCATVRLSNNVTVTAYAVVNALGNIKDQQGNIIAGARLPDGSFADIEKYLLSEQSQIEPFPNTNTTLVAVMTNAKFTKAELLRIARMASSGMARAIFPVFTRYDGDIIFAISTGDLLASENSVSVAAAEAVRLAILDAVRESVVI